MQRLLPDDTVYTNGAGNFSGWLHRFTRYHGLQHHGPHATGADLRRHGLRRAGGGGRALLHPDRTVVNIAGDGDFLMTGQELATPGYGAGRGRGKLISVVVDNGTYGTIRMHQEREYPGRVSGSDLFNPDFAALARAYGWYAGVRCGQAA
jgi:acetolactate synthase-1/2/3 large subunit